MSTSSVLMRAWQAKTDTEEPAVLRVKGWALVRKHVRAHTLAAAAAEPVVSAAPSKVTARPAAGKEGVAEAGGGGDKALDAQQFKLLLETQQLMSKQMSRILQLLASMEHRVSLLETDIQNMLQAHIRGGW